jgi:hypothetical protein
VPMTVVMANSEGELQRAVILRASACRKRGMEINASKGKIMHITKGVQRRLRHRMGGRTDGTSGED